MKVKKTFIPNRKIAKETVEGQINLDEVLDHNPLFLLEKSIAPGQP